MATILSVKEKIDQQRSSYRDGRTVHQRQYLVVMDSVGSSAEALTASDGTTSIPGTGSFYHGVPFASKDAETVANSFGKHWTVSVEYSADKDPEADDIHPLDRPAEVSYGSDNVTEPYFIDRSPDRKPLANSAGEAFESEAVRDRGRLTISVVKNLPYWDPAEMERFGNTVNAEGMFLDGVLYAPGTLRLLPPTATRQVETVRLGGTDQEVVFYRATFNFVASTEGHRDRFLDVGYSELVEKTETVNGVPTPVKKLRPIYDSAAGTLRKPWPLSNGRKKPSATDRPEELEFQPYEEVSWALLML